MKLYASLNHNGRVLEFIPGDDPQNTFQDPTITYLREQNQGGDHIGWIDQSVFENASLQIGTSTRYAIAPIDILGVGIHQLSVEKWVPVAEHLYGSYLSTKDPKLIDLWQQRDIITTLISNVRDEFAPWDLVKFIKPGLVETSLDKLKKEHGYSFEQLTYLEQELFNLGRELEPDVLLKLMVVLSQ